MRIQDVAAGTPEVGYTYGVLAFLLVCLVAWLVRERSRAIRAERLLLAAKRYARGDMSARPGVRGPDELGVLADAVEQMARQLDTLDTSLRDRQQWIGMLLEQGADVILALDRQWRIAFAGPSVARVLGWTPDQVARRPLAEYLDPDETDAVHAALELSGRSGGPGEPIAFRFRHGDGGWRSLEAVGTHPRDWTGPEHLILTARDITARERLEAAILRAREMEALGRFAGGVAHEFDNLLTAIQGHASLLLMDLGPMDPRREELEQIRRASERATALTRQVLAFSRAGTGQTERVDLNRILGDLSPSLPRLIGADLTTVTRLDPALRPVRADPGQMEEMVMHLVTNARDAMPGGGRLTLETADELVAEDDARVGPELPPGRYAVLTVSDTGSGIAPKIRERIFDPFFTTGEPGRGAGLGLSMVYGIVKQAGGHLEVESEPGRGSVFRIYLPQAAGPDQPRRRGQETILLVDDEESVRVFARRALERQGYTVLEACHGREALSRVAEHRAPLHLVITDLLMPEMGGGELGRRLGAERPGLPVLYMSAETDGEAARRGLGTGSPYLRKPFTPDGLARKVREVLG